MSMGEKGVRSEKNRAASAQITNLQTLYMSERIREVLRHIRSYPLTTVVAPMGYGKTTALNWYLESREAEHGESVFRLSIYADNEQLFWRQFQEAFNGTSLYDELKNMELPEQGVGFYFFMELFKEYAEKYPEEQFLFIDDFHLLPNQKVTSFIVEVAKHLPSNLHLIVASRDHFLSAQDEIELGNHLYTISQDDLRLNYTEVSSYCKQSEIVLPEQVLENLYHITEGWFSGVYLSVKSYLESGSIPTQAGSIYEMMDEVLLKPLSTDDMEFLLSLCLADEFTLDMAKFLSEKSDAEQRLETLVKKNAFIKILPDHETFRYHHILKECAGRRFNALPKKDQNKYITRYGRWYEEHELYAKAMEMYSACKEWQGLFRVIGLDQAMELSYFTQEIVIGWVDECPDEILKKDPLALLVLIRRYFSWRLIPQMQSLRELFLAGVEESDELSREEKDNFLGECELVMSFTAYNDIEKMSEFHQSACKKMTRPALTMGNRGTWTFGSPSVLAMFHRESGHLDAEIAAMHRSMPYYYKLTDDHGMGAEYIMEAEALFLRGDIKNARLAMEEAEQRASLITDRQKEMRYILLCCLSLEMQMSLFGGDDPGSDWYDKELAVIRQFRSPMLMTTLDLVAGWYYAFLGMTERIPEWIRKGSVDETGLLFPARPVAQIIVNEALLADGDYATVLAGEKQAMGLCLVYPYTLCQIYLELQLAEACLHMDQLDKVKAHTVFAAALAGEDEIILPFARRAELLNYMPADLADSVKPWVEIYSANIDKKRTMLSVPPALLVLTEKEQQVAMLMIQGKRNKEIASTLFLSEGTVKQYINHIYGKLSLEGSSAEKRDKLLKIVK